MFRLQTCNDLGTVTENIQNRGDIPISFAVTIRPKIPLPQLIPSTMRSFLLQIAIILTRSYHHQPTVVSYHDNNTIYIYIYIYIVTRLTNPLLPAGTLMDHGLGCRAASAQAGSGSFDAGNRRGRVVTGRKLGRLGGRRRCRTGRRRSVCGRGGGTATGRQASAGSSRGRLASPGRRPRGRLARRFARRRSRTALGRVVRSGNQTSGHGREASSAVFVSCRLAAIASRRDGSSDVDSIFSRIIGRTAKRNGRFRPSRRCQVQLSCCRRAGIILS